MQKLAVLIESHWPGIPLTSVDQTVMAEAFRRKGVTYDEAVDAIYGLAEDGERFQPRSPAILSKVAEQRKAKAREERYESRLQLDPGVPDPEDAARRAREIMETLRKRTQM
jgi:hypothetical protein